MTVARHAHLRPWTPVLIGTLMVGSLFVPAVLGGEGESVGPGMIGALLLVSPYLLFAVASRRQQLVPWAALLAVLVASTLFGLAVAGSSSTGGLVFLWLLPAQWGLSAVAHLTGPGAPR